MLMAMLAVFSRSVNARLVNWLPWSVLKISDNRALSALLFLYRAGIEQELPWLDNV